jgi:hypothetical protein
LKLHGSLGMRVHAWHGKPRYFPYFDGTFPGEKIEINDQRFLAKAGSALPEDRDPEPLIVFPFEKDFVREGFSNHLVFRDYVDAVWRRAERIVESAEEIWFIGYSFAVMDRTALTGLLNKATACKRIVIQNRKGETNRICQMLSLELKIKIPLEPYDCDF